MTENPNAHRIHLITERLRTALDPQHISIIDESHLHIGHAGSLGGGGHYKLQLVSNHFVAKSAIERHKMIYQALGDAMGSVIHALSIQAQTPAEVANQLDAS